MGNTNNVIGLMSVYITLLPFENQEDYLPFLHEIMSVLNMFLYLSVTGLTMVTMTIAMTPMTKNWLRDGTTTRGQ